MSTFTIADSFDTTNRLRVNLNAPLALGYTHAVQRAMELSEERCMSFTAIAYIMSEYHGWNRGAAWWSRELRKHGAEPRPRGIMCCGPERIAA